MPSFLHFLSQLLPRKFHKYLGFVLIDRIPRRWIAKKLYSPAATLQQKLELRILLLLLCCCWSCCWGL